MSKERFAALLGPVIQAVTRMDLSKADAVDELAHQFPIESPGLKELATLFEAGVAEGWLCGREANGVRYSRFKKASSPLDVSIDAVRMDQPGPGHTHPNGEVDVCFPVRGDPRFDGRPAGWTVYPPGSWHVPTVTGGLMNILYFLPGGAITFEPKPEG
ncbi:MAG: DUF4863 family protein [Deltaproteobacteria bacterium]|nr:DUF4863 family protein [Deltaproteobacteria bacterium]